MSINIASFSKLSELISLSSKRKPKIVLNPEEEYCIKSKKGIEDLSANIIIDVDKWEIPEDINTFVDKLSQNQQLNNEEKILLVYEKLCKDYTYDDNVLSYMRKNDYDKFALPDWYGRNTNLDWKKNRQMHNRRVCYEISRNLAKALTELFKDNNTINTCILWDKDLTHYFVGLICDEYILTLDLDDFNNIKDLTRLKSELTIEGIKILEDNQGKFEKALQKFNTHKSEHAIKKIGSEIENSHTKNSHDNSQIEENDDIVFLKNAVEILKEKGLDSQGIFEYMKEIVDINLGPESRKKVWKKIEGKNNEEIRYTRCLAIDIDNQKYIVDVDTKEVRPFDEEELLGDNAKYIPYKELSRNWDERYNGI